MVVPEVLPARRRRLATVLAVVIAALALSACRIDVAVDVTLQPDGSGTLVVTLTADAEVLAQAGGLDRDLRLDDLEAAGWTTPGLVDNPEGGAHLALTHTFRSPEELNALLASLNGTDGPFRSVAFARQVRPHEVAFTISGAGQVTEGLASFADTDLLAVVGATPYAADVLDAGLAPSEAVRLSLTVRLPGEVAGTTGTRSDGAVVWEIPLDGTPIDLTTNASWSRDAGGGRAYLATGLQVLFVAWIVLVVLGTLAVVAARRRRRRLAPVLMVNHPTRRPGGATVQVRRGGGPGRDDAWADDTVPLGRDPWDDDGWEDGAGPDDPPPPPRRPTFPLPDR